MSHATGALARAAHLWLFACALGAVSALCGAQSDPASTGGRAGVPPPQAATSAQPVPGASASAPLPAPTSAPAADGPPITMPPLPGAPAALAGTRGGIALILPTKAPGFERAAELTRKGFMAARDASADKLAIELVESDGTAAGAAAAYQQALAKNAAVIVGPLTKAEVGALQGQMIPVPTLMLNSPDGAPAFAPNLYMLALSIEGEARAAAEAAYRPDAGNAVIVATPSPLSKRAAAAFAEAWARQGGTVTDNIEYTGNPVRIRRSVERDKCDLVFLAADSDRARLIKPFLGRNMPVISTSQVYAGAGEARADLQRNNDLNGLRFVDMPWLLQPDHPAVMVFPRPDPRPSADLERLYALGIDAYRIAEQLARSRNVFELDGVTGRLAVRQGLIARAPLLAQYRDGQAAPAEEAVAVQGAPAGAASGSGGR